MEHKEKEIVTAFQIGESLLKTKNKQPLSIEQSQILLKLMFLEKSNTELPIQEGEIFALDIMRKRLECFHIPYNSIALTFLSSMADRPGIAVMYAAAYLALSKLKDHPATLADLCSLDAFGMGFPTEEELDRIWNEQKATGQRSDNWLDHNEAWA